MTRRAANVAIAAVASLLLKATDAASIPLMSVTASGRAEASDSASTFIVVGICIRIRHRIAMQSFVFSSS